MSITSYDKVFSVNDQEYGYLAAATRPVASGGTISLYVPKVHGAITDTSTDKIVTNGLFANDKTCMPAFATRVYRAKALPAIVKENCNWLDKVSASGVVPAGSAFTVEFLNGNIAQPYATTK